MKTISVKAVGTAMVPDFDALSSGIRRFVGRRFDAEQGGFVPSDEAVSVRYRAEYLFALKDGDLEPADEATAQLVGKTLSETQGS